MKKKLVKAEKKIAEHDIKVEEVKTDLLKRMRRMEEQNEEEKRRLNELMELQMN
jgi:hypothetical protein